MCYTMLKAEKVVKEYGFWWIPEGNIHSKLQQIQAVYQETRLQKCVTKGEKCNEKQK